MEYRHTQIGWVIIAGIAGAALALFLIGSTDRSLPNREIGMAVLVVALGLFSTLTTEVRDGVLACRFGVGLIRRTIELSDILAARSVRNPWVAGWGIRWLPGEYVLWNVSGTQAVELELKNGATFRIGTDEPEALLEAIHANDIHSLTPGR